LGIRRGRQFVLDVRIQFEEQFSKGFPGRRGGSCITGLSPTVELLGEIVDLPHVSRRIIWILVDSQLRGKGFQGGLSLDAGFPFGAFESQRQLMVCPRRKFALARLWTIRSITTSDLSDVPAKSYCG